ncbi:TetR/AcrR family transcriptional regulator [Nocardia colli]|uniref:TetR/AcrR family transcriptional regulator n=1 Tax=Nocardia colli TaxID=2545717 RepID=UPI0035DEBFE4
MALLMRRRGYYATGLNEVIEASQAPKGSLYHHFPGGKEQLAGEAVTGSATVVAARIDEAFAASESVGEVLRRFAELLSRNLTRSGFRDGCPVATVTLDAASDSELIHLACKAGFVQWRDGISGQLQGRGYGPEEARELAVLFLSAFEGALIVARAIREVEPLFEVADSLTRRLDL